MRPVVGRVAFAAIIAVSVGAFGCSGDSSDEDDDDIGSSGVSSDTYLDELTPDEQRRLCEWAIAGVGGPGEKMCGENRTVDTYTVDECAAGDWSAYHCAVGTVEDCVRAVEGDACRLTTDAVCAEYIQCAAASAQ